MSYVRTLKSLSKTNEKLTVCRFCRIIYGAIIHCMQHCSDCSTKWSSDQPITNVSLLKTESYRGFILDAQPSSACPINKVREAIQKNKEYQKGKVPNLLGPPPSPPN